MRRAGSSLLLSILSLGFLGCVDPSAEEQIDSEVTVPSRGAADTLDVGEWNLEWFGSTGNGPTNEALQLSNARDVIVGANLDIWGLEEIVSQAQFDQLKAQLTGYDGFLANDARVTSGSTYYSSSEQKVGVLFKSSVITVKSARLILTANDSDFAGRPPLEIDATATINGVATDFFLIVLHAKAIADSTSYQRRVAASNALKAYLDGTRPTARVITVGDYNDDLDVSIYNSQTSPYQNFVSDTARYATPTKTFSDTGKSTTVSYTDAIDHHIVTNELAASYVAGSAEVFRVDSYIASYGSTTSDHYPTLTRWKLSTTPPPSPAKVIINEILANEPSSTVTAEFVELVNLGGSAADLSGWTVSDGAGVKHTFASGTSLAAGKAITVFGGAASIPGGITAVAASTGTLALGNSGDTVTVRNAAGTQVDGFTYSSTLSAVDGVSMNRSPDATEGAAFVLHTQLSAAGSSAGLRASGAAF
ncbi:MAG TPA: lamin tail domain-containing protein [Kofleriaceae bacterium]|nr:lamin tail domain-containing protein [Kofleriaceae bacterium]